jgi:hypothetical protein
MIQNRNWRIHFCPKIVGNRLKTILAAQEIYVKKTKVLFGHNMSSYINFKSYWFTKNVCSFASLHLTYFHNLDSHQIRFVSVEL